MRKAISIIQKAHQRGFDKMEADSKCPNCGRKLTAEELYCYFCEMNLSKLLEENKKQSEKTAANGKNLKNSKFSRFLKKIFIVEK